MRRAVRLLQQQPFRDRPFTTTLDMVKSNDLRPMYRVMDRNGEFVQRAVTTCSAPRRLASCLVCFVHAQDVL
jgi:hypothetical protein